MKAETQKILVVGGAGYIGSRVSKHCVMQENFLSFLIT